MIEFDEYKGKLNALKPTLGELGAALKLDDARRELEELRAAQEAEGFWNDVAGAQKNQQRCKQLESKLDKYAKLCADWDDDEVILHVKDTGIGISPENLEHVFDRFYKVDRAHSGLGSGLGLSIAKELLEFMGERIWVTSEPGKGSEFSFSVARREKAPDGEEGERPDGGAQENGQEDGREEKNDDSKDDRLRDTEA